jgi:hypothetical protein
MQVLPIDITAVIGTVMALSVVVIPVIGITARFALKPTVEALSQFLEGRGQEESTRIMERRIALLEQQVDVLESGLRRVEEVTEFDHRLRSTRTGALESGAVDRATGAPPRGAPE